MKKITVVLITLVLAVVCAAALAEDVDIQSSFPDAAFRSYVQKTFDRDGNGKLDRTEIADAKRIEAEELGIRSVKGIEKLIMLEVLDVTGNELTSLDLSGNPSLFILRCYNNQISTLDLSNKQQLTDVQAYNNRLTSVNVNNCVNLRYFDVSTNQLTFLDATQLTGVEELYCSSNKITGLDLTKCAKLEYLIIDGNPISSVNVSANTALSGLDCANCGLKTLDLSANRNLHFLDCTRNSLTKLDLSKNPLLCKVMRENEPVFEQDRMWWANYNNRFHPGLYTDRKVAITTDEGVYTAPDPDNPVAVTGIKLNKSKLLLTRTSRSKKPTSKLKATVSPSNANNRKVVWKSSNTRVAKVDSTGKVTGLRAGTATITCTSKENSKIKATCKVTVRNKPITKITLDRSKATLRMGRTLQLKVKKITPADALNKAVKWSSSNRKVATVDSKGKVTAVMRGTCDIICTAKDGSKVKAKCRITVK